MVVQCAVCLVSTTSASRRGHPPATVALGEGRARSARHRAGEVRAGSKHSPIAGQVFGLVSWGFLGGEF